MKSPTGSKWKDAGIVALMALLVWLVFGDGRAVLDMEIGF